MKIIRSNEFHFEGEMDTDKGRFLLFINKVFNDYCIMVRECKYIDVSSNRVEFLKVSKTE